jgi:hypothetical protein
VKCLRARSDAEDANAAKVRAQEELMALRAEQVGDGPEAGARDADEWRKAKSQWEKRVGQISWVFKHFTHAIRREEERRNPA